MLLPLELEARDPAVEELVEGIEVKGVNGGKAMGEVLVCGAVLGGCGRWRIRKRVDVGVRKQEM